MVPHMIENPEFVVRLFYAGLFENTHGVDPGQYGCAALEYPESLQSGLPISYAVCLFIISLMISWLFTLCSSRCQLYSLIKFRSKYADTRNDEKSEAVVLFLQQHAEEQRVFRANEVYVAKWTVTDLCDAYMYSSCAGVAINVAPEASIGGGYSPFAVAIAATFSETEWFTCTPGHFRRIFKEMIGTLKKQQGTEAETDKY